MAHLVRFLLMVLCHLVVGIAAGKVPFNWNEIKYVYVFGDSYSYVQGTLGLANFSFIGDAFNLSYTRSQLLSDELIYRYTASNGANWPEFLTGCFSGLPSSCPRQLWDFAFAGADIDPNLLPPHHNFSVQLTTQVAQYVTYAADVLPHPPNETMTAWWIGINDTGDTLNNATITDFNAFWEEEMSSYFRAVQQAHAVLSSTHVFFTVPPTDRSPSHLPVSSNSSQTLKQHILAYNIVLRQHAQSFAEANPGSTILIFDAHQVFTNILDNYSAYGFTNITGYCQCDDDSYFWYNTGHPTERVHELLALALEAQLLESSTEMI
ncbi:hypothetical protein GLOTRDRAFT_139034 [Gloeophyllum trabeum ATCC 11539]|uniref:Carbohydrate esterase family 16 protein n=1 Tax=Gloeophyllum trabeum (strain ATCC 11539 / FP-39264 / Madison 617) TaxID=670483 RepID=S7Q4L9_GLOTA|nr:uncharacterized protein GLOTRDRAFT_139034 [Gloeophyllum trabeum ATCC 11539]EPQ54447.1 hypothetical protein GLOTRDRAFT_139034 [Gloeophyllum trabeum ATCC 11539]